MSKKNAGLALANFLLTFEILLGLSACSDDKPVVIAPGAFSQEWPTAVHGKLIKSGKCSIDTVNGKVTTQQQHFSIKRGVTLALSGWAFSTKDGVPAEVYVQLVGPALTYTGMTLSRSTRPDVNQLHNLDPSWNTGFTFTAVQNVEPNEYEIHVLLGGKDGIAQCTTGVFVQID